MPRYTRNMGVTAKIETTAGVNALPSAATDGLLIAGDISIEPLNLTMAERNLLLPYFGGSQSLIASVNAKMSFSVEWAPSGTAGTAAAWSALIQACAAGQATLATPARIEHTPVSTGLKTLTVDLNDDGVLHELTGAMGNMKLSAKVSETPKLTFDLLGTYNTTSVAALPSIALSAWKPPLPVAKASIIDVTLGGAYAAGALSGGTSYNSSGLEIDFGNKLGYLIGGSSERAEITDRSSTCNFELELTATQEVAAHAAMISNTLTSIGFAIGNTVGSKLILFAPNMQRTAAKKVNRDGVRFVGFDGKLLPSASGNDEWRLVQA